MFLPESFIYELKEKSDIVDIVSSYVRLNRKGNIFLGLCPFHNEKTASFCVYPQSNSFYCFGCGAGGDIISFIEKIENLDYLEAIKFLAQKLNIVLPEHSIKEDKNLKLKQKILEINRQAARFFHEQLIKTEQGKAALEYLKNRQVKINLIRKYGLGFAPKEKSDLTRFLQKQGFSLEEITKANLAFISKYGNTVDKFINRIIFPIIDLRGNVIAFGGRALEIDQIPKYLNSAETLVFKKGSNLFSLNFAKNQNAENIILVEGYMDALALFGAGFKNTVATLGTALTTEQAKLLSRYAKEIVVCYDSDSAGQKAAVRAIEILRTAGVLVKILTLKGVKDPDEFFKKFGKEAVHKFNLILEKSDNDMEFLLEKAKKQVNIQSSQGKVEYLKEAVKILAKLPNKMEQEVYAFNLSAELNIEKSTILDQIQKQRQKIFKQQEFKELKNLAKNLYGSEKNILNTEKKKNLKAATAEEALIAFIIINPDLAEWVFENLQAQDILTSFNRGIYNLLQERVQENKAIALTDLTLILSHEEITYISKILAQENLRTSTKEQAKEYIKVILEEKNKLLNCEVALWDEKNIMNYMKKLKEQKIGGS